MLVFPEIVDYLQGESHRSTEIENRYRIEENDDAATKIQKKYLRKLEYRCECKFK